MYRLFRSTQFNKQVKKLMKSGSFETTELIKIFDILANNLPFHEHHRNHKLHGEYGGMYECHIRPDLLLIYKKNKEKQMITLVEIGSHSELFE